MGLWKLLKALQSLLFIESAHESPAGRRS